MDQNDQQQETRRDKLDRRTPGEKAALGGLCLALAAWLHTSEAQELTEMPVANNVLALLFAIVGIVLFVPLMRKYLIGSERLARNATVALALLLAGGAIGFTLSGWAIDGPIEPRAVIGHFINVKTGYPVTDIGKETKIDIGIWNNGKEGAVAWNVVWYGEYRVSRTFSSRAAEKLFIDEFAEDIAEKMKERRKGYLIPDDGYYQTVRYSPTENEVEDFRDKEKLIYVIIRATWTDAAGDHGIQNCSISAGNYSNAWSKCLSHDYFF